MGSEDFQYRFIPILLIFVVALSMIFLAMPVYSGGGISHPHGTTINVAPGENFLLRYRLYWDEPTWPGMYGISIQWTNYENKPEENLRFLSARAYWDNGDNITSTVTLSSYGDGADTVWQLTVANTSYPNPYDDDFTVDIWMKAAGVGNVSHVPTDNHPIVSQMGKAVAVCESGIVEIDTTDKPITVKVITAGIRRGVIVSISPGYEDAPPGATLSYTVTVTNTGNTSDSYSLIASDNMNWAPRVSPASLTVPPGESRVAVLNVTIPDNATPCTRDSIRVTATGTETENSSSGIAHVSHAPPPRGVEVSISPSDQSGQPGVTLTYTVTITNTGTDADTYGLTALDVENWGPSISENRLEDVGPGENEDVTLSVTIPEDAESGASDNIIVIATSQADPTVGDSTTCVAITTEAPLPPPSIPYPVIVGSAVAVGAVVIIVLLLKRGMLRH